MALPFSFRACAIFIALALPACVTVRPQDREFLAERSMLFGSENPVDSHDEHVFNNREGSFGAGSVTGGGCGCN